MAPVAWIFYLGFAAAALWHAPQAAGPLLQQFTAPPPTLVLTAADWWERDWSALPATRNERGDTRRWPLDLQIAGPIEPLRERLESLGWSVQPQANWIAALSLLDRRVEGAQQPVLPATLGTEAESLLLRRSRSEGTLDVVHLWRAPARLADDTPLWVGTVQSMRFKRHLGMLSLWQPEADQRAAWRRLSHELSSLHGREEVHPASGVAVLRLRTQVPLAP
jgi:hypothetical protein